MEKKKISPPLEGGRCCKFLTWIHTCKEAPVRLIAHDLAQVILRGNRQASSSRQKEEGMKEKNLGHAREDTTVQPLLLKEGHILLEAHICEP